MPNADTATRRIPYVDFPAQYAEEKDSIHACVEQVFSMGDFVGGGAVEDLEKAIAAYCGVSQAVCVNSGTDALILTLTVLGIGPGDEVITQPNSFIASAGAIAQVGATPVFADVNDDQNIDPAAIDAAVGPNTKAIMPVHLTGRVADMPAINAIAEKHGHMVVEDAAQSFGSCLDNRQSGTFGQFGCFSAHPLKNLNAAGDAGFVVTDDDYAAARLRRLRNHGLVDRDNAEEWGGVSRMDTLQAALLLQRLEHLDSVIRRRRKNVDLYRSILDPEHVFHPSCGAGQFNTFHTFVVQVSERDDLKRHLEDNGIGAAIHYPVPLHLMAAAKGLGYKAGDFPNAERQAGRILSLPVHQHLSDDDVRYVAETINRFYQEQGTPGA